MMYLNKCNLCPHMCLVDRENKKRGFCKSGENVKIALSSKFFYEEPCISGTKGSGAVFFSNCNLRCVYCQNYKISKEGKGKEILVEELADIFLNLQEEGACNINLVTPTIYALHIKEALILAKKNGLNIPVIYNSSGYENVDTIKELDGLIDVYLPDFKYCSNELGLKYSGVNKYFDFASCAILEMYRQVGHPIFDNNGIIKKGLIIRNLILPNNTKNTKNVLEWIVENIGKEAYVSIMAQYFPTNEAQNINELNRKITKKEYHIIEKYMYDLGLENGYFQRLEKNEEKYVPNF